MTRFSLNLALMASLVSGCSEHASIGEFPPEMAAPTATNTTPPAAPIHGLKGEYFASLDWTGTPVAVRVDPLLNLTWALGMPVLGLGETFSARWTGEVEVPFDDTYTILASCDDTCPLSIGGHVLFGETGEGSSTTATLTKGRHRIEARLSNLAGTASISYAWSSPALPKEIIASVRLFPAP